jgi:glycosyltransferase involved in cell wall biosynthesis
MKILYVINRITKTSIPLEIVNFFGKNTKVTIVSFYDVDTKLQTDISTKFDNFHILNCGGKKSFIKALFKLKKIIKDEQYDILHTHHTISGSVARLFSKNTKLRVVHTVHANHKSYTFMQNLIIGLTFRSVDTIVANSYNTLENLKKWQKFLLKNTKKVVVYNGVDVDSIRKDRAEEIKLIIDKYDIFYDDIVILSVGRLVKVKNHLNILKAFEKLIAFQKNNINMKLFIIGDGQEKKKLEDFVIHSNYLNDKNTTLTGLLDRDVVFSFLKRANIFVMASFYEGFCNALVEALVSGVYPIISDISIFREILNKNDLNTFNPKNVNDIYMAMKNAVKYQKDHKSLESAAYYSSKFSLKKCANEYEDVYNSLKN